MVIGVDVEDVFPSKKSSFFSPLANVNTTFRDFLLCNHVLPVWQERSAVFSPLFSTTVHRVYGSVFFEFPNYQAEFPNLRTPMRRRRKRNEAHLALPCGRQKGRKIALVTRPFQ